MVQRLATSLSIIGGTLCFVASYGAALADDYYRDKQISLILGYNAGGGYDLHARLVANALPRHIPGTPKIILRHMPGAGSIIAANFLQGHAAEDGLTIGLIGQQLAVSQALKDQNVRYDLRDFKALGRVARSVEATVVWHTSSVKSLADAMGRQITLAATSAGSTSHALPLLVSRITGAKFKLVTGYQGVSGAELAMERGETDGAHATVSGLMFTKAHWLKENKISVLVQYAKERDPSLPDTPTMTELGKTPDDKKILSFFASPAEVGYSFLAPPKTPVDRVQTMRQAFAKMLDEPSFAAEMKARSLSFDPLSGENLQALIAETLNLDPELVERGRSLSRE